MRDNLYFQLEEEDKALADSGYARVARKNIMTKEKHSAEFKEFLAAVKIARRYFTSGSKLSIFLEAAISVRFVGLELIIMV